MMEEPIPFDNSYSRLPERFYSRQPPAQVESPGWVHLNESLAQQLGVDPAWLRSEEGLDCLSGNRVPVGSDPLAQVYAGHQFGGFVPQLGDGRAILLGEVVDEAGIRRDIQLKGAGRTPYSRGGDGKAALGPVLREYLMSEAMNALGVPTTRALAAVTTGEVVLRQDGPLAGAVLTRVAASHLRVGTFQYFAAQRDEEAVRRLADYAIARHFPECLATDGQPASSAPYRAFLQAVLERQAGLVAQWMALGFIHGVMNTDNCSIAGETLDYGPCAMMDAFHPDKVFSSIDREGRYAWGNQPNIAHWNLTRLAETLLPLLDPDRERAIVVAREVLDGFSEHFSDAYMMRFRDKFGLAGEEADGVLQDGLSLMANHGVDFTLFFRALTELAAGGGMERLVGLFAGRDGFEAWLEAWLAGQYPGRLEAMRRANPVLIPRNHRVEQAIEAAYDGDLEPFMRLLEALRQPFAERDAFADLQQPPSPAEEVRETFCGT